jgi:hypothetical protein
MNPKTKHTQIKLGARARGGGSVKMQPRWGGLVVRLNHPSHVNLNSAPPLDLRDRGVDFIERAVTAALHHNIQVW